MSLINDASLILTPNAVKEGKLYSIIPSNGNGDMTVVRATATATRTNELGLIEPTPYNLLGYSEMFSDVSWVKNASSISINTTTAPNGSLTADTFTANGVNTNHLVQGTTSCISGLTYTFSAYVKKDTNNFIQLYAGNPIFGPNVWANFDINNGVLGTIGSAATATITSVGNGWYRCTITGIATATLASTAAIFCLITSTTSVRGEVNTLSTSVYIWGAQLVQGSVPKDYFYTTDRLNVPRLNYDSVGGCPSILVEPQRTNLLLNSVWAGGGSLPTSWTFATNTGTTTPVTSIKNPNVTAYRFVTSNTRQEFNQTFSLILNQVVAFSCYVESVVIPIPFSFMLRLAGNAGATGTVIYLKNNIPVLSNSIIEAGNTYSVVLTCTVAGSFASRIGVGGDGNITGDITLSMPQLELGAATPTPVAAYSTSFIPTTTQTITRNADIISRSNIYTNNLITSAGGTFFIELNNNIAFARDASRYSIGIDTAAGGLTNGFSIKSVVASSQRLTIVKIIASVQTNLYTTLNNTVKIAIDWNGTTADVFVNGVKVVTGTAFTTTNMEFLFATAEDVPKYIKSMMLFPKPLTDAECIALTTL